MTILERTQEWLRKNGIKFKRPLLSLAELKQNPSAWWERVAFSIYNNLVEADSRIAELEKENRDYHELMSVQSKRVAELEGHLSKLLAEKTIGALAYIAEQEKKGPKP